MNTSAEISLVVISAAAGLAVTSLTRGLLDDLSALYHKRHPEVRPAIDSGFAFYGLPFAERIQAFVQFFMRNERNHYFHSLVGAFWGATMGLCFVMVNR